MKKLLINCFLFIVLAVFPVHAMKKQMPETVPVSIHPHDRHLYSEMQLMNLELLDVVKKLEQEIECLKLELKHKESDGEQRKEFLAKFDVLQEKLLQLQSGTLVPVEGDEAILKKRVDFDAMAKEIALTKGILEKIVDEDLPLAGNVKDILSKLESHSEKLDGLFQKTQPRTGAWRDHCAVVGVISVVLVVVWILYEIYDFYDMKREVISRPRNSLPHW